MPLFAYRAMSLSGERKQGTLEANSAQEVVAYLQERDLMVVDVSDGTGAGGWRRWLQRPAMTGAERILWTQQLQTLLTAGQPLDRALGLLAEQARHEPAKRLIERLRERVKGGTALSTALAEEHGTFPPFYIGLVRAGEMSGRLEGSLTQLHAYMERAQSLRSEVSNALIYPAFLLVGVLGSLALLLSYVVPQFVPIFADLGVPIPLITQAILLLGELLRDYGLLLLALPVCTLWLMERRLRQPEVRLRWQRRWLTSRPLGPFLQRLHAARLARTLGTLLQNGVALDQALVLTREVSRNAAICEALSMAAGRVKDGALLSAALAESRLLPILAIQMIQVGEEAGRLDEMLLKAAALFDIEIKRGLERFMAALTPCLTLIMTLLVAVIMLSILLPLTSLTSGI
ncbi:hypothetical protein L861_14655 [Litchfieldella anticariensis FP35 = DSM 16096]|uniref:Type II secretion system protein GspF domain-containing protein n=1 Tax=Litchfieldella anticariensis (strain DSM 16096 / CECT 5854 / CIP 108499 / LMG 22089 / FP35) TaxID=1121939 RepID=S2KD92_LITA3|nr:type II secretion system F family protein [Halomonas anticariensis]EPC00167.1 hypothetical protein L861_14655 [Halomonas anticariensis FP35 = DSM 16096]